MQWSRYWRRQCFVQMLQFSKQKSEMCAGKRRGFYLTKVEVSFPFDWFQGHHGMAGSRESLAWDLLCYGRSSFYFTSPPLPSYLNRKPSPGNSTAHDVGAQIYGSLTPLNTVLSFNIHKWNSRAASGVTSLFWRQATTDAACGEQLLDLPCSVTLTLVY